MAFQISMIKLRGNIDDLSFYKSKEDYLVRKKGGVEGSRIRKDPSFARTRENNTEFGRASMAAKLLRGAFRIELADIADGTLAMRSTQAMLRIVRSDGVGARGERTVSRGDITQLQDLQFNGKISMARALIAPYSAVIDRVAGTLTVDIPSIRTDVQILKPEGATHFRFIAAGCELDFEAGQFVSRSSQTPHLEIGPAVDGIEMVCELPAASTKPLVLAFGIVYSQVLNGKHYSLKSVGYNAMAVVKVDHVGVVNDGTPVI